MDTCNSQIQVGYTTLAEDSRRSSGEPEIHQPRRCHFRMDVYSPTWPMEWSLVNSLPKSSNSLAVTKPQVHESGRSTSSASTSREQQRQHGRPAGRPSLPTPPLQLPLLHICRGNAWKAAAMPGGAKALGCLQPSCPAATQHPQAAPITTPLNKKPRTSGLNF